MAVTPDFRSGQDRTPSSEQTRRCRRFVMTDGPEYRSPVPAAQVLHSTLPNPAPLESQKESDGELALRIGKAQPEDAS